MDTRTAKALREQLNRARSEAERRHISALRDRVRAALAKPPPIHPDVYLFGSWATGTFDAYSATDLLAVIDHSDQV